MKKSEKQRVSWPSDYMLCQVKMFVKDDCPAKISCHHHHQSCSNKPKASLNLLPPGFERTQYATTSRIRNQISHIPRIKWKKPPKFILNGALLVGSGEESKETKIENLRIDKVLEAFYPHLSLIPNRPSVSLAVENERYDDSKTPNIRLTPIEDEPEEEEAVELPSPTRKVLPELGPDLSVALNAALMKTKEPGSNVDADLLVKFLSDPNIVKKLLMNDNTKGKPLDIRNPSPKPVAETRNGLPHNVVVPVSVQSSVSVAAAATTNPPLVKPTQGMSSAVSMIPCSVFHTYPGLKPLPRTRDYYQTAPFKPNPVDAVLVSVSEQKTVPKPPQSQSQSQSARNGTDSQIRNGLPRNSPVSVQSSVSSAAITDPPLLKPSQAMSSVLSMKPCSVSHTYQPLPRTQDSYQTGLFKPNPVSEHKTVIPKPQTGNVAYPNDPVKNLDYYKNLIREHGGVVVTNNNNNKGRVENMKVVKKVNNNQNKVQKQRQRQCMYFGRGKGCKLGESCLFLHDKTKRLWSNDADFPREAKRLKF